ncbi:MAG: hypothetical protein ACRD1Z_02040, partial [Vicinamibacteria bacterium]
VVVRLPVEPLRVEREGERVWEQETAAIATNDAGLDAQAIAMVGSASQSQKGFGVDSTDRAGASPQSEAVPLCIASYLLG